MADDQAPSSRRRPRIGDGTLLEETPFRRLWLARLSSQIAVNGLAYALMIVVIDKTGSTIHTGLLVLSLTLPQVGAGLVAGVAADQLSKRVIAALANLLRLLACLAYLSYGDNVWAIYAISFGFAAVSQFHATAENAAVPALVSVERLSAANALFNLASIAGQALGMLALAPLFLKTLGPDPIYVIGAVLFGLAAVLTLAVGSMDDPQASSPQPLRPASLPAIRQQFSEAWRLLRTDRVSYAALLDITLVSTALLVAVIVLPRYMTEVLSSEPENAVYVFSPAALGLLAGLRLAPAMARILDNARVTMIGFALFAALLPALAFIELVGSVIQNINPFSDLPLGWLPLPSLDVMVASLVLAAPLGFAYALVSVSARAVLHERAPREMRGRILSAQIMLGAAASLIPIVLAGLLAHVFGVRAVIALTAAALMAGGLYARYQRRQRPALGQTYGEAV